jgi:hypothetical protein
MGDFPCVGSLAKARNRIVSAKTPVQRLNGFFRIFEIGDRSTGIFNRKKKGLNPQWVSPSESTGRTI